MIRSANINLQPTADSKEKIYSQKPIAEIFHLLVVTDVMMRQGEGKSLVQTDTRERNRFFRTPRIGSRRIRNRLVQKYGLCNISLANVPKQRRKYFRLAV